MKWTRLPGPQLTWPGQGQGRTTSPSSALQISTVLCLVAQSCPTLCDPTDCSLLCPWRFSRQEYWSGLPCPPPGDLPTQGLNPGLQHYRQILYQLSHQGSPRTLECVAYPFCRGSFQARNQTGVSCTAGRFFYQLSYQGSPISPLGALKFYFENFLWSLINE